MVFGHKWYVFTFAMLVFSVHVQCITKDNDKATRASAFVDATKKYMADFETAKIKFISEALYSKNSVFTSWSGLVRHFIYEVEQSVKKSTMSSVNKNMVLYACSQLKSYSESLFNCLPKKCGKKVFDAKKQELKKTIKKLTPIEKSSIKQGLFGKDDDDTVAIKQALQTVLGYLVDMYESAGSWAPQSVAKK